MSLIKLKTPAWFVFVFLLAFPAALYSQSDSSVSVKDLTSFANPAKESSVVADVNADPFKAASYKTTAGEGIIVADGGKTEDRLVTQQAFGDAEIEFDFLVSKGTVSAIWLQGRYRLNLSDSWGQATTTFSSLGGVGQYNNKDSSAFFSGAIPLINVAKAPGLWQHVRIRFKAPQFTNGSKTANATLDEVSINQCVVQANLELQGPAAGSIVTGEAGSGPIAFVTSGGLLALKNLRIGKLPPPRVVRSFGGRRMNRVTNPITIEPQGSNYLLRSFLNFKDKKRTHVISVGSPLGVNYSYDLKQGALLQVWNGPFVDVTDMWEQRGEPQLAKPLGSVVVLSETPALAKLADNTAQWPDSVAFDDFKNMGYILDKQRNPSFEYETGGYHVMDKIAPGTNGVGLIRQFTVTNVPPNLYCRIAGSTSINSLGKGLYIAGDKSYYIQVDENVKPLIRKTATGVDLLAPIQANMPFSYSLIW